jgi:hypothetical protein
MNTSMHTNMIMNTHMITILESMPAPRAQAGR